jgi:XTP/dITP diphosphohydrolase
MKTAPEKILIATRNLGKVNEIRDLVSSLPVVFLSLNDVGNSPVVVEDGATFEENALKKAGIVARETNLVTLADD